MEKLPITRNSDRSGEIEGILVDAALISIGRNSVPDWAVVWALQTKHGNKILNKYYKTNIDIATEIVDMFCFIYK